MILFAASTVLIAREIAFKEVIHSQQIDGHTCDYPSTPNGEFQP
jgi:hypothetical protein